MKRFTLAAATALMLAGPLATTATAQSYDHSDRGDDDRRGDRDRDDDRRGDWRDDDRGDWRGDWRGDDRGDRYDRNDDRRDRRGRNHRRHQRWDSERHNGYSYNGRWYYGPPPGAYEDRYGYEAGYRNWRRGERLPSTTRAAIARSIIAASTFVRRRAATGTSKTTAATRCSLPSPPALF